MIASPLSVWLMDFFKSNKSVGVGETFATMGIIYLIFMLFGVFTIRIPGPDWRPSNWNQDRSVQMNRGYVDADGAVRTRQFYLLFAVLMLNVTAGIGVLGQASVMIQEMFSISSVGDSLAVSSIAAGGFVGLLSLFNMLGRFIWSSLSDKIGRKSTYNVFFILGILLYVSIPTIGNMGSVVLFVLCFGIIISMYGGGFATIPAYLRDMFGTIQVGAIHGRLLLAWSAAAILGPVLINYMRAYQIETLKLPTAQVYSFTMYIMAVLLGVGLICNNLIKPLPRSQFIDDPEKNEDNKTVDTEAVGIDGKGLDIRLITAWVLVSIPLIWGVSQTLIKSLALFGF